MTKVAIVGLGNAARALHLPALASLEDVELVGGCDLDGSLRETAGRDFNMRTFADLGEMLTTAAPEVVVVATPPAAHVPVCVAALEAGAHVLCEKPLAPSLAEADTILAAAERGSGQLALNHEFRCMPIFQAMREKVGSAGVGGLVTAQAWQCMDLPPWKEPGWRGELLTGVLYEAGLHLVDFLLFLFDEKPISVSAATSSCGASEDESDAVALVTLEFSRGRLAQVTQNRLSHVNTQYFEVRADCQEATLRASYGGRARLSAGMVRSTRPHLRVEFGATGIAWSERGTEREAVERNPRDAPMDATRRLIAATLEAFATGGTPPASGQAGRDVLEVIAAAYQSARTGKRVNLREGPPEDLTGMF
ncbi:MAG: Gfo/Idh/MocA family oxidoreductase [Deltaproteobacteria bacterium]|nr:Gfo/Idh/MocA family oxidoreductase [Deltaproteobacteria bacterium]MBW2396903.1 Gfo/Idh/MocA family oxidoreductase [Deltaproteobacteria bacterium]